MSGDTDWRVRLSSLTVPLSVSENPFLSTCLDRIIRIGRLSHDEGVALMNESSLIGVKSLADMVKRARFENQVFYNRNLHVNTTNICVLACRFCAFRKGPKHNDAYELKPEQFVETISQHATQIDEVHTVGGLHPNWKVEEYAAIFSAIKHDFSHIHIKSLTAIEIIHISKRSGLSIGETLGILKDAGLDSVPGGGAEILVDSVRDRICRGKESSDEYLEVHSVAHSLGIPTNCTMLFGTVESINDRITHLVRLREQQDKSGGFQCFVPYPFLPDSSRLPEAQLATSSEVVRMIAVSRLMLDNIPHIKAYRMNLGDHLSSICLNAGADDIDGTVGHEEIMHDAGSTTRLDTPEGELIKLITSSGSKPIRRNSIYSQYTEVELDDPTIILPIARG
ncbi:MAG: aminofutalosine synthase MqnE [Euryarchaeota archaeon]|nr:aminofutalosine synthase MqnE [Euryarchaeota archaeon]